MKKAPVDFSTTGAFSCYCGVMTISVKDFVARNQNKFIYIPGYKTAECVAVFWRFNTDCNKSEPYSANGAADLWNFPWKTYQKIIGVKNFRYGDQIIWSGKTGAYTNGGYGHVATFLQTMPSGFLKVLTQNPGATRIDYLSPLGVLGALRGTGVIAGVSGETLYNRKVTNAVAYVRTAPRANAPLINGYPEGIAKGATIALKGYVKGQDPYGKGDNAWGVTKSGGYVWMNAIGNNITGLPYLGAV